LIWIWIKFRSGFSAATITWRVWWPKTLGKQVEEILLKIRRRICTLKVMSFLVKMNRNWRKCFLNGWRQYGQKLVGKEIFNKSDFESNEAAIEDIYF
jgi:hypothetical protein